MGGGQICYKGADLRKLRTRIGMEGQATALDRDKAETAEKSMAQLMRVGLADKVKEHTSRLSDSQKQRVAITRALAMDHDVMMFDEVTSAMDWEPVGEVLKTAAIWLVGAAAAHE
ncbi:MAG: ATP-binding cassette domain-containing protein [Paracoccaceae bacterium]